MTSPDAILGVGFSVMGERARLEKTAQELEAVVVTQLLKAMRSTVTEGGLFEKSAADKIFSSMLDSELARVTAERSPFGLADAIIERYENRIKETGGTTEAENGSPAARTSDSERSWRI